VPGPADAIDATTRKAALESLADDQREVVTLRLGPACMNLARSPRVAGLAVSTVQRPYVAALGRQRERLDERLEAPWPEVDPLGP